MIIIIGLGTATTIHWLSNKRHQFWMKQIRRTAFVLLVNWRQFDYLQPESFSSFTTMSCSCHCYVHLIAAFVSLRVAARVRHPFNWFLLYLSAIHEHTAVDWMRFIILHGYKLVSVFAHSITIKLNRFVVFASNWQHCCCLNWTEDSQRQRR